MLGVGFLIVGVPNAIVIALICALLEWIPVVGSMVGCVLVVLVAATDHPNDLWIVYAVVGRVRRSTACSTTSSSFRSPSAAASACTRCRTVLMVFIGGAVAGIPGLILALPLAGVVGAIVGTTSGIVHDPRLRARDRYAKALLGKRVTRTSAQALGRQPAHRFPRHR